MFKRPKRKLVEVYAIFKIFRSLHLAGGQPFLAGNSRSISFILSANHPDSFSKNRNFTSQNTEVAGLLLLPPSGFVFFCDFTVIKG